MESSSTSCMGSGSEQRRDVSVRGDLAARRVERGGFGLEWFGHRDMDSGLHLSVA